MASGEESLVVNPHLIVRDRREIGSLRMLKQPPTLLK